MSSQSGKASPRYLNVDEMLARIERLRAERAARGETLALDESDPCVWSLDEHWVESPQAQAKPPVIEEEPLIQAATGHPSEREDVIWVGDDLAIHLEGAERLDAFDDSDQTYDSDAEVRSRFALPVSSTRNLEASRFEWMTKWTRGGYGAGVAALAVMALIAFGSLMQVSPRRNGGNLLQFVPSQTAPANSIATTVEPSNGGMSLTEPAAEPAALPESPAATAMIATRHVVQPAKTEQKVREALASQGYSDLGVSVSRSGDVFLAGEVYSKDEVHYIVRVAHHASPAASVHFPHPDIQTASGPAYLGVDNASAVESGVKVNQIVIGSPAYKAGIRPGDIITALNGKRIYYQSVLESLLAKLRPGDRVGVELKRDGSDESLKVRLAEYQQVASR